MKKHSRLYKMLSVFSALAITAPMFVISASASVNDSSVGNPNYISYNQDFYNSNSELCNTLIDSMENLNSEIDVEKYQLSINDIKKSYAHGIGNKPRPFLCKQNNLRSCNRFLRSKSYSYIYIFKRTGCTNAKRA